MNADRRALEVQAVGNPGGDVVFFAAQHDTEFTVLLNQLWLLLTQGRGVGVVGFTRVHAKAVVRLLRGVDAGVFQCGPAQLQKESLLRVQHGGFA